MSRANKCSGILVKMSEVNAFGYEHRTAMKEYEEGVQKFISGDAKSALEHFTKSLHMFPLKGAFLSRSRCFSKLGRFEEALQDARTAVDMDDTNLEAHMAIFKCCLDLGNLTALRLACSHTLDLYPDSELASKYQRACASLQEYEQKYKDAYASQDYKEGSFYMEKALFYSPNCVRYKNNQAECFAHLGKLQESLNIAHEILAKNATDVDAIYNKALCYYYQQRFSEGLEILKLLFKISNDHQSAIELRKQIRQILKSKEENKRSSDGEQNKQSLIIDEQRLKNGPESTMLRILQYCKYAVNLMKQNNLNESLDICNKAIELDKNNPNSLIVRGTCYTHMEDWLNALKDFRLAYQFDRSEQTMDKIIATKKAFKKVPCYYYKILEIDINATNGEIKKTFRKLSLMYHPDKHSGKSAEEINEIEDYYKEINSAYNTLIDHNKRFHYDFDNLRT